MTGASAIRAAMMKGKHGKKLALSSKPPRGPKKGGGPRVIATSAGKRPVKGPKQVGDRGYYDKKGKKWYSTKKDAIKAGRAAKELKLKKDQAQKVKSAIADKLKERTSRTRIGSDGKYRSTVKMDLGTGAKENVGGLTPADVSNIIKKNADIRRIDAQKKAAGTHIYSLFGGLPAKPRNTLGEKEVYVFTPEELKAGVDIEGIPIQKFKNKKGRLVQKKQKTTDYQIYKLDESEIKSGYSWMLEQQDPATFGKLTKDERKAGYVRLFTTAAVVSGGVGMVGTAYAEPGTPRPKPGDPMAGVVAIGGDFFQGVRNTASDWTFGASEGKPSLDTPTKAQFGKVVEGAMEQGMMFGWDRENFEARSKAGTLPLDQAWATAGKFAAEKPAMFAGEVLGEAGIWAGTMGMGRAVWGVGRGVKLAKLTTGPHTTATKAQAGQYKTLWEGAKGGLKETKGVMIKDPFGLWTGGFSGMKLPGTNRRIMRGQTKDSLGVIPGYERLGQTNVGKMRKSAGKRYSKGYLNREGFYSMQKQSGTDWFPGPQLALPGSKAVKSAVKKTKKGEWARKGIKKTKKKLKTRADYLAHARKIKTTKRQKKQNKMIDDANDSWVRSFYTN